MKRLLNKDYDNFIREMLSLSASDYEKFYLNFFDENISANPDLFTQLHEALKRLFDWYKSNLHFRPIYEIDEQGNKTPLSPWFRISLLPTFGINKQIDKDFIDNQHEIVYGIQIDKLCEKKPVLYYEYKQNITRSPNADESNKALFNYYKTVISANNLQFVSDLKKKPPELIHEHLTIHCKIYEANGGNKKDWIEHTKKLMPTTFDARQKYAFYSWFEQQKITPPQQAETKTEPGNKNIKPEFVPKPFHELLINPTLLDACLTLLKNSDKPCINDANEYLRNKGVFIIWFNAMERKKMFNQTFANDKERTATLNYNFYNLNVSESLFRQDNIRATERYKTAFENEIAAIKS